jgi:hypothetical protein
VNLQRYVVTLSDLPGRNADECRRYDTALTATSVFIDWYYTITAPSLTETNLHEAEGMLREFDTLKQVFVPYSKSGLAFPKMHALTKYATSVRENGSVQNYTSRLQERGHKRFKEGYRRSNKNNVDPQMAKAITRNEAFERKLHDIVQNNDGDVFQENGQRTRLKRVGHDEMGGKRVYLSGKVPMNPFSLVPSQFGHRFGCPGVVYALRMYIYDHVIDKSIM